MTYAKYTVEEIQECIGLNCIYTEYSVNGEWRYAGEIVDATRDGVVAVKRSDFTNYIAEVYVGRITEIPYFDALKGKPIFNLVSRGHGKTI